MRRTNFEKIDHHLNKSTTAKTLKKRIEHRNKAVKCLKDVLQHFEDNQVILIDKLTNAATTIREQDDWIKCLYMAMKSDKDEIIKIATILKQNNKGAYNEIRDKLRRS
jgi:hypothetical protein